jgi:hypothetical protein
LRIGGGDGRTAGGATGTERTFAGSGTGGFTGADAGGAPAIGGAVTGGVTTGGGEGDAGGLAAGPAGVVTGPGGDVVAGAGCVAAAAGFDVCGVGAGFEAAGDTRDAGCTGVGDGHDSISFHAPHPAAPRIATAARRPAHAFDFPPPAGA